MGIRSLKVRRRVTYRREVAVAVAEGEKEGVVAAASANHQFFFDFNEEIDF